MQRGWSVKIPGGASKLEAVYVNGVPQLEGRDFRIEAGRLIFDRQLAREGRLGPIRWLSMLLGIAGTYRQDDSVDVIYTASDGQRRVVNGLDIEEVDLGEAA